jgi:asparagine synthase (glutamine-hydrolysing)
MLFGWVAGDAAADARPTTKAMAAALIAHDGQQRAMTALPGFGVGVIEPAPLGAGPEDLSPAVSSDCRHRLWMAGEVFHAGDAELASALKDGARTPAFRSRLLQQWLRRGPDAIRDLDGEYQIAVWDDQARTATILNDRFGGLPLYVAESSQGVAFAGGVRGVLMAPGIGADPDADALREAMTFGGYRLGDRTNVAGVRMVPGASVVSIQERQCRSRRYWTWNNLPASPVRRVDDAVTEVAGLWRTAIARRLRGPGRFGQTLSGGLDSRAILAEVPPAQWTAVTYGVPGCDDARYAERAARAVGAHWQFYELYGGHDPDWLDRRSAFIQPTDGLMQLGDLMHLEALHVQRASFDIHLSGYIGDAVSGPTFGEVTTAHQVMQACPFYGAAIGLPYEAAVARVGELMQALDGASARFFLFDHKLPQSTNRWPAAWRPWLRVRKPFLDYAFFDFCQGLPAQVRVTDRLHERWLRSTYPRCFASIPNHKTGVPVLTPQWRVQLARAIRYGRRTVSNALPPVLRPRPRVRSYFDDDRVWRLPSTVDRIVGTILRRGSLCCDILGREPVAALMERWKTTAAAPAQIVGALYVYERYHRDLPATLAASRASAPLVFSPVEHDT